MKFACQLIWKQSTTLQGSDTAQLIMDQAQTHTAYSVPAMAQYVTPASPQTHMHSGSDLIWNPGRLYDQTTAGRCDIKVTPTKQSAQSILHI